MEQLIPRNDEFEDDTQDFLTRFSADVEQLTLAASVGGYVVTPEDVVTLWRRHSEEIFASWLAISGAEDADLLACMLKHAVVMPIEQPTISPPDGYSSWLDYAVESMDTRSLANEQLLRSEALDNVPSREQMHEAARLELLRLRNRFRSGN